MSDETAWLVETGDPPTYWDGGEFVADASDALRFARQQDAERVAGLLAAHCRAVEHMWLD